MDSLLNWLKANPALVQVLASVLLVILTLLLAVLTAFYATTTWLTLRLLRKDFEHRIRPVLQIDFDAEAYPDQSSKIVLALTCSNAPIRILSAISYWTIFTTDGAPEDATPEKGETDFGLIGVIIPEGQSRRFELRGSIEELEIHRVKISYEDIAGLRQYEDYWDIHLGQFTSDMLTGQDKNSLIGRLTAFFDVGERKHRKVYRYFERDKREEASRQKAKE